MRGLLLVVIMLTAGSPVRAQYAYKAGDAESTVHNILNGLFAGVALPKELQDSALRIVRKENTAQVAIDGRAPGSWDKRLELNKWRDSSLRMLLRSDADRKVFDANAERLRPQGRPPR
jgi:hypothetical protein